MSPPEYNNYIGLSLHPDEICMVELENGLIRSIAFRELIQPFDLKTFHAGGAFLDNQVEAIQDLHQRLGAKSKALGVVLHSAMVLIKKIPVALGLNEAAIVEHVSWEAEQFLSSPLDDFILDYERLPFKTSEGNPVYLLILVRKSIVSSLRSIVERVGLNLYDIDVDVFSNIRTLLVNYDVSEDETSVLIDIQRDYLSFLFIKHREYFLSHRIFSEEKLTSADFKEEGDIVQLIIKELRRLIFGHRMGRGLEDLGHIYLVGCDVTQEVAKELASSVAVPLEVVNPFRRIDVSDAVTRSKEFVRFPERFVSSIGITLKRASASGR